MRIRRVPAEWLDRLARPKRTRGDEIGAGENAPDRPPSAGRSGKVRDERRPDEGDDD